MSPRYAKSFGTFDHAFPLMGVKAFMPPQGLLVLAGYVPDTWQLRFVDENIRPATAEDFAWAEAVLTSGMHVQRPAIHDLVTRAHAHGRVVAVGGPSVSACPEWYPDADLVHVGELGDGTDALIARLDRDVSRPDVQERYETTDRLPLAQFPVPAYELLDLERYFLASVQFSSGCPFTCEFCDIPELYGRNPRLKRAEQVIAELDAMLAQGNPGTVYFVDDNFIGNPRAALELLPALVAWQERRNFPVQFACEATLNISKRPDILELMREAYFTTVFCGIETPETEALAFMKKRQNLRTPILDSVATLNSYGLEVVSGIIMGLDTDTAQTPDRIIDFIEASGIPLLTVNLLEALPRTPLWRRLEEAGRILDTPGDRESNVEFLRPYDDVVAGWRRCITTAFAPEALYRRFADQAERTYPNRRSLPTDRIDRRQQVHGLAILARVLWHVGVQAPYRRVFWRALRNGRLPDVMHAAIVSHHLVRFAQETLDGRAEKSFYAAPVPVSGAATA